MKQRVNLYLPEFRKKKEWLNAARMLQIMAATVGLMLLFTAVEWLQYRSAASDLAEAEARRDQATQATQSLIASYGAQVEDQSLVDENLRLLEELNSKQAVLKYLSGVDLSNTMGFSQYLIELGEFHTQGVRLTEIKLLDSGNNIELKGQVANPGLVSLYLQNLSQGAAFKGKSFGSYELEQTILAANENNRLKEMRAWTFDVATTEVETTETTAP